tara:strand:+ start:9932 stop:10405 length:474 start_codon:yes stop_codon:yes gene_type:complete
MDSSYLTESVKREIYRIFSKKGAIYPTSTALYKYITSISIDRYPLQLEYDIHNNAYSMKKIYIDFKLNQSQICIIFPNDRLIISTCYNIARNMSGISLYLKYETKDKYFQFKLYDADLKAVVLSPIIIISDLSLDSIVIESNINQDNQSCVSLLSII